MDSLASPPWGRRNAPSRFLVQGLLNHGLVQFLAGWNFNGLNVVLIFLGSPESGEGVNTSME